MNLTVAISTHGAYAQYLEEAAASALEYADEVVIYDNGGECFPVKGCRYVPMEQSGCPTQARIRGIAEAKGDWILHLDADDLLIARPPEHDADWIVSDMPLVGGGIWTYMDRDHTVEGALRYALAKRETPICSKSAWRLAWLRENGLTSYRWPSVQYAEDCLTVIEYLLRNPRIVYDPANPFYAYRIHGDSVSFDAERESLFRRDLGDYLCRLQQSSPTTTTDAISANV